MICNVSPTPEMPESLGRFERIPFGKATFLEVNPSHGRYGIIHSDLCYVTCVVLVHPILHVDALFLYLFVRCLEDPG